MTSSQIRQLYLDFFQEKGHKIVQSAPIVLKDDPTLLFSNSGMTQFKDIFLGYATPQNVRVADTQKCLRVSGKHNDLDDVGRDTYHHTMFEMLGNWSFGDYFKEEAIAWAWELLTQRYLLPKEDLFVTVFEGDSKENLEEDFEAKRLWQKWVPDTQILFGNKKDNFWEMGESGPCGPCSEIHIDLRTPEEKLQIPGKDLVNQDHPQVVEVWNLVFMEYLRKADGSLEKLPQKHVDTGMGFERLCMALQGKKSNYDTDVFTPLISEIEKLLNVSYTAEMKNEKDIAIRVLADHIRAVSFAIADGQLPSSNGAGYVIRRILRRAISFGFRFLEMKSATLYKLVSVLASQMGHVFPEIISQQKLIENVIQEEENSFLRTIEKGLERLSKIMDDCLASNKKVIPGEDVFILYDTFGFPSDLSRIIAEEKGLMIDEDSFETEMEKQKSNSRRSQVSQTEDWTIYQEAPQEFVGYDILEVESIILRQRKVTNAKGEKYQIVLKNNPFYCEGGGQIGDSGYLFNEQTGENIRVENSFRENALQILELSEMPENPTAVFTARVDKSRREDISRNHTATHLLHEILREELGTHVEQKGSYVGDDYLRFDFSHFSKITDEELKQIEINVLKKINQNIPLEDFRNISIDEAKKAGAMALFGEKYGDKVRMVVFGNSKELCGGTHVPNTLEIGNFIISSESSSAAGIRRIEAITGKKANQFIQQQMEELASIKSLLKSKAPLQSIHKLLEEKQELEKEILSLKQKENNHIADSLELEKKVFGDGNIVIKQMDISPNDAKKIIIQAKSQNPSSIYIILTLFQEKPGISIGVSADMESKYPANILVKEFSTYIQGGGGGNSGFASAGGKNPEGLQLAKLALQQKFLS